MSTRTVIVHNLSVEDLKALRALQRAGASDDLVARDVLRAGLKSLTRKAKAEARKKTTLEALKPETLED